MPNHIQNELILKSSFDVNLILSKDDEGKDFFDFNKIIPMPKELNITSDGFIALLENQFCARDSFKEFVDRMKGSWNNEEDVNNVVDNFCQGIKNYIKYGSASWYNWSIENWGTKWNSYSNEIRDNKILFQTAWSCPLKIFIKLHELYPDLDFEFWYSDEDSGNNCGYGIIDKNNKLKIFKLQNNSQEAIKLFIRLHPDREYYYELKNGEYIYKEDEE